MATAAIALLLRATRHASTIQFSSWAVLSALGASYVVTLAPVARVSLLFATLQLLCAHRLGLTRWYLCWWPGLLFYATGHYCEFAGLQYAAGALGLPVDNALCLLVYEKTTSQTGFVGYPTDFNFIRSGLLLALNTFAPFAAALLLAALLEPCTAGLLFHRCWTAACCCACAALHRRHLMVWGVFAPKLLFELCWLGVQAVAGLPSVVL